MSEPIEAKDEQVCNYPGMKGTHCGCFPKGGRCCACGYERISEPVVHPIPAEPKTVASDTSETATIAAESAAEAFLRGQLLFRNNCNKRLSGINRAIIAAIKIELYEEPHE